MARTPRNATAVSKELKDKLYQFSCKTSLKPNSQAYFFGRIVKSGRFSSPIHGNEPSRYFYVDDIRNNFVVVFFAENKPDCRTFLEAFNGGHYIMFSGKTATTLEGQTKEAREIGKPPYGGIYRQKIKYVSNIKIFHSKIKDGKRINI